MKKGNFFFLLLVLSILTIGSMAFSSTYLLRPGDVISVQVYGHQEFTNQYTIGPDGHVQIFPVGDIYAKSLSVQSLSAVVAKKLEAFVSNPEVTISIQKYAPFVVYVLGAVENPGAIQISKPSLRLSMILSLVGGVLPDSDLYNIRIVEKDGKTEIVNFSGFYDGKNVVDPVVSDGDTVVVPSQEQTGVFVMGEVNKPGIVKYTPNMSILDVIKGAGGFTQAADVKNILVFTKDNTVASHTYNLSGIYKGKLPKVKIVPGSIFVIPRKIQRFAYVLGAVEKPGLVTFLPNENETVLSALSKAGGIVKEKATGKIKIVSSSFTHEYKISDVLSGKVSVPIENGTLVYVEEQEFYAYVVGAVRNPGRVSFLPGMPLTIGSALSEAGGVIPAQNLGKIILVENGEKRTYDLYSITAGSTDEKIKNGALIYVPRASERYVYMLGAVKSPGRVDFGPNEPETLITALAKVGGLSKDASSKAKIISCNGSERIVEVSSNYSGTDIKLKTGDTIVVEKNNKWAYVYGEVSKPGMVAVQPNEVLSLRTVLAKAGISLQKYKVYVSQPSKFKYTSKGFESSSKVETYTSESLKTNDVMIPSGTFVFVEPENNQSVFTYGEFQKPGEQTYLPEQTVTLGEVVSKAGGLKKDAAGTIIVMDQFGNVTTYQKNEIPLRAFEKIPNSAFVYAPKSDKNYVAVIGNVQRPGTFEISSPEPLLKVLGMAGGLLNWDIGTVQIISSTQTTTLSVSPKKISSIKIYPGQIVYAPTISTMKVYVFGQVKRPGVFQYEKDMTVLEAILKAGGTTKNAELSRTFIFKGGPNNSPEVLDLSKNGVSANNLVLSPGDIVYVPQSLSVDVMQIISNVTSLFNLANSGIQLWRNVQGQ